jgi:diguanylate cyclase (GGDEF)-like protein/PAS domain S-box-containing protein
MNRCLKEESRVESVPFNEANEEREILNRITDIARDAIVMMDNEGKISFWNPAAKEIFGYSAAEALGQELHKFLAPRTMHESYRKGFLRFKETGEGNAVGKTLELNAVRRGGAEFPVELSLSSILIRDNWHAVGIIRDISERKRIEGIILRNLGEQEALVSERTRELVEANNAMLAEIEERKHAETELHKLSLALEQSPASIVITDREGTIEYVNPKFTHITGYAREEAIGRNPRILKGDETDPTVYRDLWSAITSGREWEGVFHNRKKNGEFFWEKAKIAPITDAAGAVTHFMAIKEDITEQKRLGEALSKSQDELVAQHRELANLFLQVEHQANHDGLTSLPNRTLLADRIHQAILRSRRNHEQVAIIFVDLDNFKFINDSMGHDFGDELLRITAQRLVECVRRSDTVARQGGDEFVIIISGTAAEDFIAPIAAKIRGAIARPVTIKGHELTVTCSIGISIFPKDGDDVQTLVRNADVAMYRAKEMGRDNFQFYSEELNSRSMARMTMEAHLRRALEKNEFSIHYQPKVSLCSGLITGMEALLRWQSPELGMVSPADFIPLAEETGLIGPIGEWVLKTACTQNRAWQESGLPPMRVAVNVSGRQFKQANLVEVIGRILRETGLGPHSLELEITERALIQNVESVIATLVELKEMGIHLAMDDFGSGYASLHYLRQFPFDKLKIDCSFIRDITINPDSSAIARTVIAMAHSLRLKVIAEGVESEGQLRYLRNHGCDEMQGYYFSRPVPVAEMSGLLQRGHCLKFEGDDGSRPETTVLVVDDAENAVNALQRTLSLDGYHVLTANSAMEGFELLATTRVAVVISDQWMPHMNGSEFLSRVKEIHPDTVRILITGKGDLESVTDAVNKGAIFKYLTKPWDDDFLRDTVGEAFRHYLTMQQIE